MNYTVGQTVLKDHRIECINEEDSGDVVVWIRNAENEILPWKRYKNVPIHIEYNLNFD